MLSQMAPEQLDEWMAAAILDNLLCDPFTGRGLPVQKGADEPQSVTPNQAAAMFRMLGGR